MKHINIFIKESYPHLIKKYSSAPSLKEYKINLNLFDYIGKINSKDYNTKRYAQTANEIFNMIEIFCSSLKSQKLEFSLDNRTYCGEAYKLFLKNCKFSNKDKELKLKQFYLDNQDKFRGFFLSNSDDLNEKGIYLDWIKQLNGSTLKKEYEKYCNSKEYIKPIHKKDIKDLSKVDPDYIIVYSRWNPEIYELFEFKAESSLKDQKTEHLINMFKMNFHFDCKVDYFECYPIQVKNYLNKQKEINDRSDSQQGYFDPSNY